MGTGLTFDEYIELTAMPLAGADPVFVQVVEEERERMFPMPLVVAANHLRSRGYDCRPASLEVLIRNGIVTPADADACSQADVDAAGEHFEDCELYTPYAAMCVALGCRYADFKRSLREAAERESRKYGRRVRDDDQLFVMHRSPPRGVTGDDGSFQIKPAVISFTLCDDIRERLERGEEVLMNQTSKRELELTGDLLAYAQATAITSPAAFATRTSELLCSAPINHRHNTAPRSADSSYACTYPTWSLKSRAPAAGA